MAKFVYRLQNVLDVKYRLESLEKTAYAQAAARLAEEESKFQELLTRQNTYRAELKEASNGVLDIKQKKLLRILRQNWLTRKRKR